MAKTNPKPTPASRPNARKSSEATPQALQDVGVSKIVFGRHGAPVASDIKAGGKLVVEYDAARSPIPGGVTAFIEFKPSGKRIEAPAVGFKIQGHSTPQPFTVPVSVEVPRGTTAVSMWFRQYQAAENSAEAWDSNFGRNYTLEVKS